MQPALALVKLGSTRHLPRRVQEFVIGEETDTMKLEQLYFYDRHLGKQPITPDTSALL